MYIEDWVITWSEEQHRFCTGRVETGGGAISTTFKEGFFFLPFQRECFIFIWSGIIFALKPGCSPIKPHLTLLIRTEKWQWLLRFLWQPNVSMKLINCGGRNRKTCTHYMCSAGVGVRFQDETLKVKSSFLVLDSSVRSVAGECNSKLWWLHVIWTLFNNPCRHCIVSHYATQTPPFEQKINYFSHLNRY